MVRSRSTSLPANYLIKEAAYIVEQAASSINIVSLMINGAASFLLVKFVALTFRSRSAQRLLHVGKAQMLQLRLCEFRQGG